LGPGSRGCRPDSRAVRTKCRLLAFILMVKGGEQFARRIPQFGGLICARRQDTLTIRTKRRLSDTVLVDKGGDQLTRCGIPELCRSVHTRREDPGTIRAKYPVTNLILMFE